eukprot:g11247.t1
MIVRQPRGIITCACSLVIGLAAAEHISPHIIMSRTVATTQEGEPLAPEGPPAPVQRCRPQFALPEKLIVSYAVSTDAEKIAAELTDGVNVLIWFAADLVVHHDPKSIEVRFRPDLAEVVQIATRFPNVAHLVCFGGWNAPHLEPPGEGGGGATGQEYFEAFHAWNEEIVKAYEGSDTPFRGFDGFDWDYEGNDSADHGGTNVLPKAVLDVCGEMSVLAKAHGYVVGLAPAQSYFDCRCPVGGGGLMVQTRGADGGVVPLVQLPECEFSYSLALAPYETDWHPEFLHQGRNSYAYLVGKFGYATFDFVSIQLYETNSHAEWATGSGAAGAKKQTVKEYLHDLATDFEKGYRIRVPDTDELLEVRIPRDRLVWGFSFGRNAAGKFLVQDFAANLPAADGFRGAMFWNVEIDGTGMETDDKSDPDKFLRMARDLAEFFGRNRIENNGSLIMSALDGGGLSWRCGAM